MNWPHFLLYAVPGFLVACFMIIVMREVAHDPRGALDELSKGILGVAFWGGLSVLLWRLLK